MIAAFLQTLASGVTNGAIYALIGLGFSMIYNTSEVINFAQGEFVMLAGMSAVALTSGGHVPLILAVPAAILLTTLVGLLVERLAIEPARHSSLTTLIIITIGVSITLRGLVEVGLGKDFHRLAPFSGDTPLDFAGARIEPQTLWILGGLVLVMAGLAWFFNRTRLGKAMLATSQNRLAAELMGIDVKVMLRLSFAFSALLGALAGVLTAPITLTRYEVGIMLGLKGFCAAVIGGLGTAAGALAGGLILGLSEAMAAGYVSSAYKDAVAFILILAVLLFSPKGLFGRRRADRV
ncbi:MAG TPA: branched-chain amino acid ABC transporter permease [Stellaceae bacterium]|nr:branched-chain amino acid ABC transporter permease [Stellaceae bacterium]